MYLLRGPRLSVKDLCGSLLYCCGDISLKGWLVSMLTSIVVNFLVVLDVESGYQDPSSVDHAHI